MKTIGIIGGGNMGTAIIKGLLDKYNVLVCEKDPQKAKTLKRKYKVPNESLDNLIIKASIIIIAVKPQDIEEILIELSKNSIKNKLVVSIAAGITTAYIEKRIGPGCKVIRTMPNMPAQINEGITAISRGSFANKKNELLVSKIFKCVGDTIIVKEEYMDAVTAVSGSGPAYVFYFVECLMNAAESLGFDKILSQKLVYQTLQGSVNLLLQQKEEASQLRAKVTSKGGTTQAAIAVCQEQKVSLIYKKALLAAKKRAKQLSQK